MAALVVVAAWLFLVLEVLPDGGLAHAPAVRLINEVRGWVRSK